MTIRREFQLASRCDGQGMSKLEIDTHCGSVCIEATDTKRVSVCVAIQRADGRPAAKPHIDFEERDGSIQIRSRGTGPLPWLAFSSQLRLRFHVTLPRDFHVEVSTRGGSVAVTDVAGDVKVRSSGGWLCFRNIGGRLHASTSGGGIEINGCRGDIAAKTGGGPIDVSGAGASVSAHTKGGAIQARFEDQPKGRLQTSGGNLDVWFSSRAGALVDARTGGGQIAVEHPVEHGMEAGTSNVRRSRLRDNVNGGGAPLVLRTKGGNIHLREA